jgi:hypothetical protein
VHIYPILENVEHYLPQLYLRSLYIFKALSIPFS